MSELRQYCTFYLNQTCFGIDVLVVQEVLNTQTMTPVPRAPEDVVGLINLRGQIVTALDLKKRLGISGELAKSPMNIIIRAREGPVSLLVDEVGDVIELPVETLERTPETVAGATRAFLAGVHKLDVGLLAAIDIDKVCGVAA